MASNVRNMKLTSVDDLFSTEESRAEEEKERVQEIPIAEIDGFPDHPFHGRRHARNGGKRETVRRVVARRGAAEGGRAI